MSKIDTNKVREAMLKIQGLKEVAFTALGVLQLCDAYDEAQNEIEIRDASLQLCNMGLEKMNFRISTLEALLREVLKIEDLTDEDGMCNICYCHMTKHDETCYISRIQKELGEG